jgi:hypothetical protein
MKPLEKFCYYVYGVRFLIGTDADIIVHQPNLSANDLPRVLVAHWTTWIPLFDFDVKHIPGRRNGYPDGLSQLPRGKGSLSQKSRII